MADRLVLFDLDGTLCDTLEVDDELFCAATAEHLGIPFGPGDWADSPQVTDSGILGWAWVRHRGRQPTAAEVEAVAAAFEAALASELRRSPGRFAAIAGAGPLLQRLGEAGWDAAIATGGFGRTARLKLRAAGLPAELLLASSDDSPNRIEIFRLAQARAATAHGTPYARTVLVGDGPWDVKVAAEIGWAFLGIASGERAARLQSAGAGAVVPDFSAAEDVLERLLDCAVPRVP